MPDPIMIQSFEKGINQSRDKQIISFGEAYDARNCDIKKGTLKRCTGSSAVNTNVYTGNNIDILMKYFVNNSGTIMVGSGSSLYKYANNSFTKITDVSSMDMDYLNYQIKDKEILIFANGSDDIRKYDGTTVSVLKNRGEVHGENGNSLGWMDADGTVKSSESLCTGKVPKGKYVELHKERLWISGIVAEPNSIYFSAPYDPEDFIAPGDDIEANQHGGMIDIPTWDGGKIIGIKNLFDDMMIFKNRNVFRIFGTYPGNYTMVQVFNAIEGDIIEKTICAKDNKAFWFSTDGLFMFGGVDVVNLTDRFRELFSTINKNAISKSVAAIYKDKYILAVPTDTNTDNNLVIEYDIQSDSFMFRAGTKIKSMMEFNGNLYYAKSSLSFYMYDSGNLYEGYTPINSSWHTGDMTFGAEDAVKNLQYVYAAMSGNGTVRISCTTERETKYKDIVLSSDLKMYKVKLKNKGRIMSFKFENLNGCDFEIKQPQFVIEFDYD